MKPKKIALFYGYISSNIGDLAITSGQIPLLRSAFPHAKVHVVFFGKEKSDQFQLASASLPSDGSLNYHIFTPENDRTPQYLGAPQLFMSDCGVEDADLIALASSEHFFSYNGNQNAGNLFWRMLPAIAAKARGQQCIVLPSTFGPFEETNGQGLLAALLDIADSLGARDSISAKLLADHTGKPQQDLLDPAFFCEFDASQTRPESTTGPKVLSLVMRSDAVGLRLEQQHAKSLTRLYESDSYATSPAHMFSVSLCELFLSQQDTSVKLWVQVRTDEALAVSIKNRLDRLGYSSRTEICRPSSVQDYISQLSQTDIVVTSRFHAAILALVSGRPVVGAYFDAHGHKMPGLFELLHSQELCLSLDHEATDQVARRALDLIPLAIGKQSAIRERIQALRLSTIAWLKSSQHKPVDSDRVLKAIGTIAPFSVSLVRTHFTAIETKAVLEEKKKGADAERASRRTLKDKIEKVNQRLLTTQDEIRQKSELLKVAQSEIEAKSQLLLAAQDEMRRRDKLLTVAQSEIKRGNMRLLAAQNEIQKKHELLTVARSEIDSTEDELRSLEREFAETRRSLETTRAVSASEIAFYRAQRDLALASPWRLLTRGIDGSDGARFPLISRVALYIHYFLQRPFQAGDIVTIARSGLFNAGYYRDQYPDIAQSDYDPLLHFMDIGFRENRNPSALFNTEYYLDTYPDVAASGLNPLLHYIRHGLQEKRKSSSEGIHVADEPLDVLMADYQSKGLDAVVSTLVATEDRDFAAKRLIGLGRALSDVERRDTLLTIAQKAADMTRSEATLKNLFWVAQRAKNLEVAYEAVVGLETLSTTEPNRLQPAPLEEMRKSPAYTLSILRQAELPKPYAFEPVRGRVCYTLHNSLPHSSGGYATRSHGVAIGLAEAGLDMVLVTRPGFPLDIKHGMKPEELSPSDVIDGVTYERILEPPRSGRSALEYMSQSVSAYEKLFSVHRPEFVIAASNHLTGLPSMVAARRLGIPFIYEVRGLWEITRISREPSFGDTSSFQLMRLLEAGAAKNADLVFTLTKALKEEMIDRGVPGDKIFLVPNSCDPDKFAPIERNNALAERLGISPDTVVIGYIGTFVGYEGLDDLARACGVLKSRGCEFRLLLVGNENASGTGHGTLALEIQAIAVEFGFSDWLIMPGRVPHYEVSQYYSLIDICPFPRKPWPVCEMVSPLKPLEAMAMEKPVVVSSVRALVEMVTDGERGLVFEKGSASSLADKLELLINDRAMRNAFGATGRKWVREHRSWSAVTQRTAERILSLRKQ